MFLKSPISINFQKINKKHRKKCKVCGKLPSHIRLYVEEFSVGHYPVCACYCYDCGQKFINKIIEKLTDFSILFESALVAFSKNPEIYTDFENYNDTQLENLIDYDEFKKIELQVKKVDLNPKAKAKPKIIAKPKPKATAKKKVKKRVKKKEIKSQKGFKFIDIPTKEK